MSKHPHIRAVADTPATAATPAKADAADLTPTPRPLRPRYQPFFPQGLPKQTVATTDAAGAGDAGAIPASLTHPGDESDHFMTDVAHEVLCSVIETVQADQGVTAEATETAVRILLLAAAGLRWDITTHGRGLLFSEMLLADLDELRDSLVTSPMSAIAKGDRLAAALRAGLAPDPLQAGTVPKSLAPDQSEEAGAAQSAPLVLRVSSRAGAEMARGWLAAFKPRQPADGDDDAPPPVAA